MTGRHEKPHEKLYYERNCFAVGTTQQQAARDLGWTLSAGLFGRQFPEKSFSDRQQFQWRIAYF